MLLLSNANSLRSNCHFPSESSLPISGGLTGLLKGVFERRSERLVQMFEVDDDEISDTEFESIGSRTLD